MKTKYILVYPGSDNWKKVVRVDFFTEFEPFQKKVNELLAMEPDRISGNSGDQITFAGEVSREWEFYPVETVTNWRWREKKQVTEID